MNNPNDRQVTIRFDNPDIPPGTYNAKLVAHPDGYMVFEVIMPKLDTLTQADVLAEQIKAMTQYVDGNWAKAQAVHALVDQLKALAQ